MRILKSVPWWGWGIIIILVFLIINFASSLALNRSLYNMAIDQLREDKTAIVENLEKDKKEMAKANADLENKVKDVQRKRVAAEAESKRLARLVNEKDAEIGRLKEERDRIVIPTDPNGLADEFRKRGYRPRVILPAR